MTSAGAFERINVYQVIRDVVQSITEDKDGFIWLGTRRGAAKMDPSTYKVSVFTEQDGLGGNNIYRVYRDSKDNLWFAIVGGEITRYDGEEFRRFGEADSVTDNIFLSVTEDLSGNMWFGSYGGGLYKYNGTEFKNFSSTKGESFETPFAIVADSKNNIWYGTSHGVEKYDQENNKFIELMRHFKES